jgi:hypothetical protein
VTENGNSLPVCTSLPTCRIALGTAPEKLRFQSIQSVGNGSKEMVRREMIKPLKSPHLKLRSIDRTAYLLPFIIRISTTLNEEKKMHNGWGIKGVSTLSLIILLLIAGTIGAVLSYLWTVGYYVDVGLRVPEGVTTLTITNVAFPLENANHFNVTLLNPTYSRADANITGIALVVTTNHTEVVPASSSPSTPYSLRRGEDITFKCNLNWGDYAGQSITVLVFVEDGSGATKAYQTEFVKLEVIEFDYNTNTTISQFNMTVRNRSNIPLDITKIRLGIEEIPSEDIFIGDQNITFPYRIAGNETKVFSCQFPLWDPETNSGYLGSTNNIVVETMQGYRASRSETFSNPVVLIVSNVTYPQLNRTQFVLTNDPQSPHYVNMSYVTISVGNETFTVAQTNATGILEIGSNVTIVCEDGRLNWDSWKGQEITIRVYTTQGFLAKKEETLPS